MIEGYSQHWTLGQDKLEAFVLHRIDEPENEHLNSHLKQCEKCAIRVWKEKNIAYGIKAVGRRELKLRLIQRIKSSQEKHTAWTQVASLAAAILLMLGAVFAIQWFNDFKQNEIRIREVSLEKAENAHKSFWITGRIIAQKRVFKGTTSNQTSSFMIKEGNITRSISIKQSKIEELPDSLQVENGTIVQTLIERTSNGFNLTIYSETSGQSLPTGIEAVSDDSLIVLFCGKQIAYHIPGGWDEKI